MPISERQYRSIYRQTFSVCSCRRFCELFYDTPWVASLPLVPYGYYFSGGESAETIVNE